MQGLSGSAETVLSRLSYLGACWERNEKAVSSGEGSMTTDLTQPQSLGGTYRVGDIEFTRVGYGAMQLAGPGVFGPPKDREAAIAVLRAAVDSGINHIDTADFYGPHVTNDLIRDAFSISRRSTHRH